jgi:hypothetical protein
MVLNEAAKVEKRKIQEGYKQSSPGYEILKAGKFPLIVFKNGKKSL